MSILAKMFCLPSNFFCLLDILISKIFLIFNLDRFYNEEKFYGGTEDGTGIISVHI